MKIKNLGIYYLFLKGDFLIIESIEEGNKVKGEIIHILSKDHIRYIKSQGLWFYKEFSFLIVKIEIYLEIFNRPVEFSSVDDDEKIGKNDDMFPASDEEAYESGDEDQEKYTNEFEQKNLNK